MAIRIKNWSKHQHFKDRTPPWIKLYRDILDDPDWHELEDSAAKALIGLWLIASEDESHQGTLPDLRRLAFRLRKTEAQVSQLLNKLSHWLVQDDINVISERYQDDAPEESRGRVETEIKEAKASLSSATDDLGETKVVKLKNELPCPHQKLIELYAKHLPHLAQPRLWDGQRQASMRQRWQTCSNKSSFSEGYSDEAGGLKFWDSFFSYIANDTKLSSGYESNGRTWVPDLPWIMNSTNFQKIVDGKYDIQKTASR